MTRLNRLIELLERGEVVVGQLVQVGDDAMARRIGESDMDFVVLDFEHEGFSFPALGHPPVAHQPPTDHPRAEPVRDAHPPRPGAVERGGARPGIRTPRSGEHRGDRQRPRHRRSVVGWADGYAALAILTLDPDHPGVGHHRGQVLASCREAGVVVGTSAGSIPGAMRAIDEGF